MTMLIGPGAIVSTDRLGGADPYSASKGTAELVIRSYVSSFFPKEEKFELVLEELGM